MTEDKAKQQKDEIKAMIKGYNNIMSEVQELNINLNDIHQLKLMHKDTLKATVITDMPINHSTISDPVFELVSRYDEQISEYTKQINKLLDKKILIEKMLMRLDTTERRVVQLRYIDNPSYRCDIWQWIADIVHYDRSWVINIFNRSIDKIAKWYNT